jgi:hypothetical protein
MLTSILVPLALVALLAGALRSRRNGGLIASRPYNNRYSDATGARDDRFG